MTARLHYIDSLRSFCMLFGIFVHANTFFVIRPFSIASEASEYFRMATFFLVSGFLIALVGERTPAKVLIKRRALALLLPLILFLCLVNPITNWLIYIRHNDYMPLYQYLSGGWRLPAEGPGVWLLHLWFLVSLVSYVLLYPLFSRTSRNKFLTKLMEFLTRQNGELAVLYFAIAMAVGVVGMRVAFELTVKRFVVDGPLFWVFLASFTYMPYFVVGVFLNQQKALFERLHYIGWIALCIGGVGIICESIIRDMLSDRMQTVSVLLSRHFVTGALIPALLLIFRRFLNQENKIVTVLSQSMYTIYLLHFLLIFLVGMVVTPFVPFDLLAYFVICVVTIVIGLVIHTKLVMKAPILLLLINGRNTYGTPKKVS